MRLRNAYLEHEMSPHEVDKQLHDPVDQRNMSRFVESTSRHQHQIGSISFRESVQLKSGLGCYSGIGKEDSTLHVKYHWTTRVFPPLKQLTMTTYRCQCRETSILVDKSFLMVAMGLSNFCTNFWLVGPKQTDHSIRIKTLGERVNMTHMH